MTEQRWICESNNDKPQHGYTYTYWVTGRGAFPYDMLRYDQAWPIERVGELDGNRTGIRSIRLRSYKKPTVDRWVSFWWSVGLDPVKD